jgi:hypothetical protein
MLDPSLSKRVETGAAAADAGVQRKNDRRIRGATLNLRRSLYYVELEIPAETLEVLGIQIDVRTTC